MANLTATQKAFCEGVLRDWQANGVDARHLGLAEAPDLFVAKRSIEGYAAMLPPRWLQPLVSADIRDHGLLAPGFASRWPTSTTRDAGKPTALPVEAKPTTPPPPNRPQSGQNTT